MRRGEIWIVSLDPSAGHEQRGTRPVLIVSPAAFNEVTGTPVVLPHHDRREIPRAGAVSRCLSTMPARGRPGLSAAISLASSILPFGTGSAWKLVPEPIIADVLARLAAILD